MIKVTLKVKDSCHELSIEEAELLYKELQKLFPNTGAPVKIAPYNPYRPYYYQDIWTTNKTDINYTISV